MPADLLTGSMPIFTVKHSTVYRYQQPVKFGEHRLMFRPRDSFDQRLLDHALFVDPEPKASSMGP